MPDTDHSNRPRFTLLATVRNEAPFLLEWVAYHKAIGFDRIVIFSNGSRDGTGVILNALHDLGEVIHIKHRPPDDVPIARTVADKALASGYFETGDWVLWLDADEFLNVHLGDRSVQALARHVETVPGAQGICISWRLFGSNGNRVFHGRHLCKEFTGCVDAIRGWTNNKTLFRFDGQTRAFYNHKPLMQDGFWAEGRSFLGSNGVLMPHEDHYVSKWRSGKNTGRISQEFSGWSLAQINHYAVRTRKLTELKRRRGRIAKARNLDRKRYGSRYFRMYDLNDAQDRSILHWDGTTLRGMIDLITRIAGRLDYFALMRLKYRPDVVDLTELEALYCAWMADGDRSAAG